MERYSSHSQKVPYARKEGRKSLFSQVKDSVKDILSPSWLSDLVSSAKTISSTGSDNKDKSPVGPVAGSSTMQPPADFTPFQSQAGQGGLGLGNGQPRTLNFSATPSVQTNMAPLPFQSTVTVPPPVSEFTSSQLPLARLTEKSDSVMANEDTMSQRSDVSKSTSGCSSMVPQVEVTQKAADARPMADNAVQSVRSAPSPTDQPASKRQRLQVSINSSKTWSRRLSDTISEQQRPGAFNRPSFNSSLLGSPFANESSLLGTSFHESSFYPGKTTYGGRSSFRSQKRKADLNQSLPSRLSVPVKAFMKAKPKSGSTKEAVTSSTAKRILEALDRMPTPMNDAKRIPVVPRYWTDSPMTVSRDRISPRAGPPVQKLNVCSLASISKNRQVITSPPHQSSSPQPSTSGMQMGHGQERLSRTDTVVLEGGSGISGKMRRDKSYHRGSASARAPALEEHDTEILPDLRTDFTLQMSAMPAISFSPASQSKAAGPRASTPTSKSNTSVSQAATLPKRPSFTFASPIAESEPKNKPVSPPAGKGFQFSSPISVDKDKKVSASKSDPPVQTNAPIVTTLGESTSALNSTGNTGAVNSGFMFSPSTQDGMKMAFTSSFSPKPKPKENGPVESGGLKPASELRQGSVMDILGGSKPLITPTTQQSDLGLSSTPVSQPVQSDLSSKFQKPAGSWTCDTCLIENKADVEKCVACETQRPGLKTKSVKSDLLSQFQAPTGSWTCDICLVQNKAEVEKCVACMSNKPGASAPVKSGLSQFQTPAGMWTCDSCLVENKADKDTCVACQTNRPAVVGSASTSALISRHGSLMPGNWICSKCRIQNKKDAVSCGVCGTNKAASPGSQSSPSVNTSMTGSLQPLKSTAGQWECELCLVQNTSDSTTCVACETSKPTKFYKHPSGDWECEVCLVNNKEADVSCVACNCARPGPPRTRAVPSCVKNFIDSKNSGLASSVKESPSSQSSSIQLNSGGGFTFVGSSKPSSSSVFLSGALTSANTKTSESSTSGTGFKIEGSLASSTGSGFKFGNSDVKSGPSTTSDTKSVQSSLGTGFKFGSFDNKDGQSNLGTGFKLGNTPVSICDSSKTIGGFKFGAASSSEEKSSSGANIPFGIVSKSDKDTDKSSTVSTNESKASGFTFGSTVTSDTTVNAGGFQFGKGISTSSSSTSNSLTSSMPASSILGQKTDSKALNPLNATTSVPGGFVFGVSTSSSSATSSSVFQTGASSASQSLGGFNFVSSNKPENTLKTSLPNQDSGSGFTFNPSNVSAGFSKPEPSVSKSQSTPFGGFNLKPTEQKSEFGGFNFAQTSSVGQNSTMPAGNPENSTKRSRDEDSAESSAKKPVNFGSSASAPFQLGATNSSFTAAPAFVLGQQNSAPAQTPKDTPNPAQVSTFNFTAQKNDTSSTNSSVPGVYNFGAKQGSAFNATAGTGLGSSAGSGTPAIFNGNAPSTTLSFGASPLAFNSTNTGALSGTTPTFGGNVTTQAAPANPSLFQFGMKPAESVQPGAPSAGFNFSASVNPAGLGPTPSFSFTAAAAPGAMAFNAQNPEKRTMKKAVRRLKR